jgi:hypothetical protein
MSENENPADETSDITPEDAETEEPAEDVFAGTDERAKFREALARKHGGGGKNAGDVGGGSKVGSAHGPAKAQRTFRRKSGG